MIQKFDQFLIELQEEETCNNITLSNAIVLFSKGGQSNSHFEQVECYTKTIILLTSMGKVSKNIEKFIEKCQQCLDQCQMNPYRLNDCKPTLNESLEQIHHIDKLEEKVTFLIKKWNILLLKGGLITQYVMFRPKIFISEPEHKYKAALFKNAVAAIDKMTVLYRYTPEAEIGELSQELKEQFMLVYKDYLKQKNKVNDDLLYWLQMFFRSASSLNELIIERSSRIEKQTKLQIYTYLQKLMEICLLEIIQQIKNNLKKVKVSQQS
ncbi:unnamed protein product [Paramecium primaurelia]|uniref:Uncharacterized protein n=1 Tax=Paramecium primaurelia TaxID=5886 RepID=A0A8S1LI25_PARPR|nr:unnamed protein product [Paramecium primaurelia]